jgi:hypothetical protein
MGTCSTKAFRSTVPFWTFLVIAIGFGDRMRRLDIANYRCFLAAAFNLPAALILATCAVENIPAEVSQSTPGLALHNGQGRAMGLILRSSFILCVECFTRLRLEE